MSFKHYFLFSFILFIGMANINITEEADLILARIYFEKVNVQESAVKNLKILTENKQEKPIFKAYLGAAHCAEAKYSWNPYTKLEKVKSGTNLLNDAVFLETNNIEIRFLRFCIEEHIPAALPYRQHISSDKNFIIKNLNKEHSYYSSMKTYLLNSKMVTESEKRKL